MKLSDEAIAVHEKARELGAAGQYAEALVILDQAHALAPEWPYPVYDKAFTYLMMEDFEQALTWYRKTVELAPRGFYTAITALDTLEREASGEFPVGTYLAYVSLEWIPDPEEKAAIVSGMVSGLPLFAPGWKEYAFGTDAVSERLAALERGLAANPDAETKGMLLINKAATLHSVGKTEEAKQVVSDLLSDPELTDANQAIANQVLQMF